MDTMTGNKTSVPGLGRPQTEARKWFEPILVVSIMLFSLYINRTRSYSIFRARSTPAKSPSLENLLPDLSSESDTETPSVLEIKTSHLSSPRKPRSITSPFTQNLQSRVLQKFPFLLEMFYWILNYMAYAVTGRLSARLSGSRDTREITQLAQSHGIDILTLEHDTFLTYLFPVTEVQLQHFFLGHPWVMTFFNQAYSLVHIPGTVAFISWFYYTAPSFPVFATVRRTMVLGNFFAFAVFSFYPCMPPRLLPRSFGFADTVRQENAESVWTGGGNVNQLAAMPSLHFTYAFIIGCTLLYHSGLPARLCTPRPATRSRALPTLLYGVAAVLYPGLVLVIIVATANHYYLDAVVATLSVSLALACNRVWCTLQPVEQALLWILRAEKPVPSTGVEREKADGRHRRRKSGESMWADV